MSAQRSKSKIMEEISMRAEIAVLMSAAPVMRICPKCQWRGPDSDCVHPKHWPLDKLCPECYEVTEVIEVFPARIQRVRHIKGWRMKEVSLALNGLPAKYVGRRTAFGNDYEVRPIGNGFYIVRNDKTGYQSLFTGMTLADAHAHAVEMYEQIQLPRIPAEKIAELRGYNLACYCDLSFPCHCDPLLRVANK